MSLLRNLAQTILCAVLVITVLLTGVILTANLSILNADFIIAEMHKADIYSLIIDEIQNQFGDSELEPLLSDALDELKPWIEEQTEYIIHAGYKCLKEGEELNITISLEPVRDVVRDTLAESASSYLPAGYDQTMPGLFDDILDQVYEEITSVIPSEFTINEAILGPQINPYIDQARQLLKYMEISYILCIFFMMLAIVLLALLHRWEFKPLGRAIGTSFSLAGIASIIVVLVLRFANTAVSKFASEADSLFEVQQLLSQIIRDATTPLLIFGIVFLTAGVGLIVLTFILKQGTPIHNT